MPEDRTEYETGARHPVAKTQPDDNEDFSQDAAANKRPPAGIGNSEPADDEKTRPSGSPAHRPATSPPSQKTAGAGPAIAERSKDAKAPEAGRQPGAYIKE